MCIGFICFKSMLGKSRCSKGVQRRTRQARILFRSGKRVRSSKATCFFSYQTREGGGRNAHDHFSRLCSAPLLRRGPVIISRLSCGERHRYSDTPVVARTAFANRCRRQAATADHGRRRRLQGMDLQPSLPSLLPSLERLRRVAGRGWNRFRRNRQRWNTSWTTPRWSKRNGWEQTGIS